MTRTHIHCAFYDSYRITKNTTKQKDPQQFANNYGKKSQIWIYIDVPKAMRAGIEFFISANNVINTRGDNNGRINNRFFRKIRNRITGRIIFTNNPQSPYRRVSLRDPKAKTEGNRERNNRTVTLTERTPLTTTGKDDSQNEKRTKRIRTEGKKKDTTATKKAKETDEILNLGCQCQMFCECLPPTPKEDSQ